jgi:tetratricopeptide (TPR) repeat protein
LALLGYLRFEERGRWRWYAGALVLYVMAVLSKSVTCSLPVVLLLLRWYRRERIGVRQVLLVLPMLAIGVAAGLHTAHMEVERVRAWGEAFDIGFADRSIIAAQALLFYAGKLIAPMGLTFIYPRWQIDAGHLLAFWPVAVVGLIGTAVVLSAIRWRGLFAGFGFFVLTLFPALGFFNVAPMRFSFVADHFQYLASLGLIALAVGLTATLFARARRAGVVIGVVALSAFATMTFAQARVYESRRTLFEDVVRKNPDGWMPRSNLGGVYFSQGRYNDALAQYEHILAVNPDSQEAHAIAHTTIGLILHKQGHTEKAFEHLQQALEINPHYARGHYNLGLVLLHGGELNEAVACLQKAIDLEPDYATAHCDLAAAYLMLFRFDDALKHARRAEAIRPDNPLAYYNQMEALMQLGQVEEAKVKYEQGAQRRFQVNACRQFAGLLVDYAEYADAIAVLRDGLEREPDSLVLADALAWQYATCPSKPLRRGRSALEMAERVCQATQYHNAQHLDTLAAALAERGDFAKAAEWAQKGVKLAQEAGQTALAERMAGRVRLYLFKKPYRGPR